MAIQLDGSTRLSNRIGREVEIQIAKVLSMISERDSDIGDLWIASILEANRLEATALTIAEEIFASRSQKLSDPSPSERLLNIAVQFNDKTSFLILYQRLSEQ